MKIPCIINNFNQYEFLVPMVNRLMEFEQLAVYILDNDSTYPPLLSWYETLKGGAVTVIKLGKNWGHRAPWKNSLTYQLAWKHKSPFYIVTDPDLDISSVPMDMLEVMMEVLREKDVFKVGLSIEIEDLPDFYPCKIQVQDWEKQNWDQSKVEKFNHRSLYRVGVDTTFAMYNLMYTELVPSTLFKQSHVKFNCNFIDSSYRLDRPYTVRHLPWYLDFRNLSENQKYYLDLVKRNQANPTSWTLMAAKEEKSEEASVSSN